MRSIELLRQLDHIPLRRQHSRYSVAEICRQAGRLQNDLFAIEVGVGVEAALDGLFDARNVCDDLQDAYGMAFSDVAGEQGLYAQYMDMVERGPESVTGFISALKGKMAELRLVEQ